MNVVETVLVLIWIPYLLYTRAGIIASQRNLPKIACRNATKIFGVNTCEDHISRGRCSIIILIVSDSCIHSSDLAYEVYWSSYCNLTIFHLFSVWNNFELCPAFEFNHEIKYCHIGYGINMGSNCLDEFRGENTDRINILRIIDLSKLEMSSDNSALRIFTTFFKQIKFKYR